MRTCTLALVLLSAVPLLAQQTAISPWFPEQFHTTTGAAAAGYKVCSYQAGTSTPLATYTDATGAVANTNPVILDSTGYGSIWLGSAAYKLVLMTPGSDSTCGTGVVVRTVDQVTVNVPRWISPQAYGAKCDGSTDDSAAITSAIAAAVAAGQPLILQGASACVTGALTISSSVQMKGPGALKRKTGVSSPLLTITAANVAIDGVTFDCNSQGTNGGKCVYANGASFFILKNSTIKHTVDGEYPFRADSTLDALIEGNYLGPNILSVGITIFNNSARVRVIGNEVDGTAATSGITAAGAFGAQTGNGSGATLSDVTFQGNTARIAMGFCGLGQSGTGTTVTRIAFTGNICTVVNSTGSANCSTSGATARACGGYSLARITNSTAVGNIYNAVGQTVDIGGIELAGCVGCTAEGNSLYGGTSATSGAPGIWCDGCTQSVITGNLVNGWGTASGTGGIVVQTVTGNEDVDDNQVSHNTLIFPAGSGLNGIYVLCNKHSGATNSASRTVVQGNSIIGQGGAASSGVNLTDSDAMCTLDSTHVTANVFLNLINGIQNTSNTTNTQDFNNTYLTVTNKTTGGGTWGSFLTQGSGAIASGLALGKATAPVQTFDNNGSAWFGGTTCVSKKNNGLGDCKDTANEAGPILELDSGDGVNFLRYRLQAQAGTGGLTLNAVDGNGITLESGSQVWLTADTTGILEPRALTVGSLASCNAGNTSKRAYVTDSSVTTLGNNVAAGGGSTVGVVCDGSNWTVYWK